MMKRPFISPTRRQAVGLFLFLFALYFLIYGGRFHVIDEVSIYALAENVAKRGALDTDQLLWSQWVRAAREVQGAFGRGGHVYSKKGFGSALLPALLIRLALPHVRLGLILVALLTNPLFTALTAVVLYLYVLRLGYSRATALALSLIYGVATLALPYTRTLFGEPVAALGTLFAFYALHKDQDAKHRWWAFLAGVGFSVSVWARLINTPAVLFLWWYQRQGDPPERGTGWRFWLPRDFLRGVAFWGTVAMLGGGGYALYNTLRFGLPWRTGYQLTRGEFFTTPPWIGFYGIVLSPFRGLVWFSPVLLAAIPGFRRLWSEGWPEARAWLGTVGMYLLLFSTWWMWWGGFAWGPRFLLPVIPLLVLPLAPLWEDKPRSRGVYLLLAWSLLVQGLAVLSDFTLSETALELTFGHPERSRAMFDPRWSPIVLQAKHLFLGFWDVLWVFLGRRAWPVVGAICVTLGAGMGLMWTRRRWIALWLTVLGGVSMVLALGLGLIRASDYVRSLPAHREIATAVQHATQVSPPPTAWVTLAPFDYEAWMNWNHTRTYALGMAPHSAPLHPEEQRLLSQVLAREGIVWLLVARMPPAHPDALAEAELSRRAFAFYHRWFGDMRLVGFVAPPRGEDVSNIMRLGIRFRAGMELTRLQIWRPIRPHAPLRVSLWWRANRDISHKYTVFLHLLTSDGQFVVGYDAPPWNGYRPTDGWRTGEVVEDRKGVIVPEGLPDGTYILEVGLYDPATGQRVRLENGDDAVRVNVMLRYGWGQER